MKPVSAKELLEKDKRLQVVKLQCYPIPEQVIWQAGKGDYSEDPIYDKPVPRNPGEWIVDRLLANDRGHYGCYSEDTSVMTDSGWKLWPEITDDDKLLAVNPETGEAKFEYPRSLQIFDILPGDTLYHAKSQKLDLLVTNDHRMIYKTRTKTGWTDYKVSTANEIVGKSLAYRVTCDLEDENRKLPDDIPTDISFLELLKLSGFYFGDGLGDYDNINSYSLRFKLKKERKIQFLSQNFDVYSTEGNRFVVTLTESAKWIKDNFTDSNNRVKVLPKWILSLPRAEFLCLLDGLKESDGTNVKKSSLDYDSTELESLKILQSACLLNGIYATLNLNHPNTDNINHKPCWRLHVVHNKEHVRFEPTKNRTRSEESQVEYSGKVYCATVSTGALLVSRNGKPVISGNCLEHPHITLNACGFVHNVIVQARTHRVGVSFDVQSQRYTGKRVQKVADNQLDVNDVFYLRPEGYYIDRQGDRYYYTEQDIQEDIYDIYQACKKYNRRRLRGYNEEHIRDLLPQAIRQNFVFTMNLRSVLHFMDLRAKKDAQIEIQALCEAMWPIIKDWAPNVCAYYEEKRLYKGKLAP